MKAPKWLIALLAVVLCIPALSASPASTAAAEITIYLDGKRVPSDVSPYIMPPGVTMVPMRVISESMGAYVDWNAATKTVTIRKSGTEIMMTAGSREATVKADHISVNERVTLDAPSTLRQGRVTVPLRFVGEQLGLTVDWQETARAVQLYTGQTPTPGEGAGQTDELRGVWVSSVFNLDWPSSGSYGNRAAQQSEYIKLLDELQAMGMNAVFVQVRPAADALYPSRIVPWSRFLTGKQGQDPGYDPLAFAVEEAHKRGMSFHAWFNPFRATTDGKLEGLAANHVALQHPEWIVNSNNRHYINPGIPEARQHIIDTILEVVTQYDIQSVHLDDYFYPSSGLFNDDLTFRTHNPRQFLDKAEWRRDNINTFVRELGQAVKAAKPQVEFGISPFGVWRNQSMDPSGSATRAGVTAYDSMSADVRTWIRQGWIDYVVPQLYWSMSFSAARYDTLVDWWVREVQGTDVDLYIGHSPYKLGTTDAGWHTAQEIINQLKYNDGYDEVQGSVFFSAKDLRRNPLGIAEALRGFYRAS
ncbi:family 10 glycosylhydrolase [Paenibacillus sp. 1P07SE]|uniref:family 10 glycosylhydrolase n=1 Tax=Paenibacillus sp. 1P07SE TaxID=3132209 RepID=UPI0039A73D4C